MLLYAGIDEAGYGPMLGPLCVAATVFELAEHDPADGSPNLWRLLRGAVCRSRRDARSRIAIDDSKKLKGAVDAKAHPLSHLERGVLSVLGAMDELPADDDALFERVGVAVPDAPWYGSRTTLPLGTDAAQLGIAASRFRRAADRAAVRPLAVRCEAIDAGDFNVQLDRYRNKATVNLGAVIRHMDAIWSRWPDRHPRIAVDRQGGRAHYREELQVAWPEASIRILAETETLSRYRLERGGSSLTVSFVKGGDGRHLPIALASMTAKLTRELLMLRLNRFFTGHLPELRPTAGYVQDGRRYVQEIAPVIRDLRLARRELVREA